MALAGTGPCPLPAFTPRPVAAFPHQVNHHQAPCYGICSLTQPTDRLPICQTQFPLFSSAAAPSALKPCFPFPGLQPSINLVLTPSGTVMHHLPRTLFNPSRPRLFPAPSLRGRPIQTARQVRFQPQHIRFVLSVEILNIPQLLSKCLITHCGN